MLSQDTFSGEIKTLPEHERQAVLQNIRSFDVFRFTSLADLNSLLKSNGASASTIRLKIGELYDWEITMVENDIRSPDFQIIEITDNGPVYHPKSDVVNTYRGYVNGDTAQGGRFFVSNSMLRMQFLCDGVDYSIEPLSLYLENHGEDNTFLVFKTRDVIIRGECATEAIGPNANVDVTASSSTPQDELYLELAADVDYEGYNVLRAGNTGQQAIDQTVNSVKAAINFASGAFYEAANLKIVLVQLIIRTTPDDPYSDDTDIKKKWVEFKKEWNFHDYNCRPRDAAVLFSGNVGVLGYVKDLGVHSVCGNKKSGCPNYYNQSYAVVRVRNSGPPYSRTLAHELGHIFGLGHNCDQCGIMWTATCANNPCDGNTDALNHFASSDVIYLNAILNGVGTRWMVIDGECQLVQDADNDYCLLTTTAAPPIVEVTQDETWDATTVPNGGVLASLYIGNGAHLTLGMDVVLSFPQDGDVKIDQGTLQNRGRLTTCADHWQGVTIYGNGGWPGEPVGRYAGTPNSVIEKAITGIRNENGPGYLYLRSVIFKNNQVALDLTGSLNSTSPDQPNEYRIFNSTFLVDDDMPGNLKFESFMNLTKVNMTNWNQLRGNSFIVSKINPPAPNWGIYAHESNITAQYNRFERLHTGIQVDGGFVFLRGNKVTDSKYGMFLRNVGLNNISQNQFYLGDIPDSYLPSDCPDPDLYDPTCPANRQFGIILESGVSGFKMVRNIFDKESLGYPQITTFGTVCTDLGTNDYYIVKDNHFNGLFIANTAHKVNGIKYDNNNLPDKGLVYRCNHMSQNTSDIVVTQDPVSIIKPKQGKMSNNSNDYLPAFNTFSNGNSGFDFFNHIPLSIWGGYFKYYYAPDDPSQVPDPYANINLVEANPDEDYCYHPSPPPPLPCPHEPCYTLEDLKEGYPTSEKVEQNRQQYFDNYRALQQALSEKEQAALQKDTTLLEQKQRACAYYQEKLSEAAYMGFLYTVLDSTGLQADSVPVWLERLHTFEAEIKRSEWYRQKGLAGLAEAILDQLPGKMDLSPSYQQDLALYRELRELANGELDDAALYQLESAANSDFRYSSAYAKNVLSRYGVYYPPVAFEIPNEVRSRVKLWTEQADANPPKADVTPNPSNGYVRIDWTKLHADGEAVTVELRDRSGNLLRTVTTAPGQHSVDISLEAFGDGVIYYTLRTRDKTLDSGQVILNK